VVGIALGRHCWIIAALPCASEYLRTLPNPLAGEWSRMGNSRFGYATNG
jgi:hypothetical protein